jgi:dipeptidyl aminopeptidase/acylaminoacyl peptidase
MKLLRTPDGIRFGMLGDKGATPAPTLFVFASRLEDSLGNKDYNKAASILVSHGYLAVSLDLPCHGQDEKAGEPTGLSGWRDRMEKGDDLVPGFIKKVSAVLDYLIGEGYTDRQRVLASGTSRGGFIAMHFAAADPRVRCVAAFAPVTNLLTLREFAGMEQHPATNAMALVHQAEKLADKSVWIIIGNNDERVGTDYAIALARKIAAAWKHSDRPANVEIHVVPSMGHGLPPYAHDEAAAWLLKQSGS